MPHPRDLERYTDLELEAELKRRLALRAAGACTVCEAAFGPHPCEHMDCPLKGHADQILKEQGGAP